MTESITIIPKQTWKGNGGSLRAGKKYQAFRDRRYRGLVYVYAGKDAMHDGMPTAGATCFTLRRKDYYC